MRSAGSKMSWGCEHSWRHTPKWMSSCMKKEKQWMERNTTASSLVWLPVAGLRGVLQVLLDFGFDVDKRERGHGWTPLMYSCATGSAECVRLLLEKNADVQLVDIHGNTCFTLAAWKGQHDCLKLIIEAKADVNQQRHDWSSLGVSGWSCGVCATAPRQQRRYGTG
jgi:hypothetical protein